MSFYSAEKAQKGLPLLYLILLPISIAIILLYPSFQQITDFHLWYLFPVWILLSHLLCGLSYTITGISLKNGLFFLINSFVIYRARFSLSHLQVALLTSLLEETIFRYFLLFFLKEMLHSSVVAIVVTSLLFTAYHFRFGWNATRFLRYVDIFIFSTIISTANMLTLSFYPAFMMHSTRNYILKTLLITKEEYEELKIKKNW